MTGLVRFFHPEWGNCLGVHLEGIVYDVHDTYPSITAWLVSSVGRVEAAITDLQVAAQGSTRKIPFTSLLTRPSSDHPHLLPPLDQQDVWAAGVTYERSRAARQEEAIDGGDVYARVYTAERPELFFKARAPWVIGHLGQIGVRADSTWNVPEPELTLLINPALEIVGYTVGNDVSSRDIEGANPLYLPQAKIYRASCAIGPQILLSRLEVWPQVSIQLQIERDSSFIFQEAISSDQIRRRADELVTWLGRCLDFPEGVLLMSGTGIIPPSDFSLRANDRVHITIDGVGTLINTVKVV